MTPSMSSSSSSSPSSGILQTYIIPFFSNVPNVAKVIIFVQTLLFVLSKLFVETEEYFCLIPNHTISKLFIWNIFTSSLIETEIISFIFTILSVIVTSKWIINKNILLAQQQIIPSIANIWTTSMYLWFLFIVSCLCGIFTLLLTFILYLFTISSPLFVKYHGFHGSILGFTMIMKQQIPEEYPINFIPLRGKDIPFVALCISIVISFIANQVTDLPFIIFGFYISWIYLRFYQTTYDGIVEAPYKGDHSDTFAFHTLFPSSLHSYILPVSNKAYNLARSLKIVSELRIVQSNNVQSSSKIASLSSNFDSIFMENSPAKPINQHSSTSSTASALLEKHIEEAASEQQPIAGVQTTTDRSKRRELAVQELEKRIQNMNI